MSDFGKIMEENAQLRGEIMQLREELERLKAMPSKSAKQRKFMAAAAHNPEFAKKAGVPQSVAKEFHAADKAKKKPRKSRGY